MIQSDFVYTFASKQDYENPTEIIDLRYFTYLSKEETFEEPPNMAQQKFQSLKRRFSTKAMIEEKYNINNYNNNEEKEKEKEPIYLILLSDLNNDDTFTFKCDSKSLQTHWIYSFERALEYKSNLLQNIIPSDIIKYIISLYFLSFERLRLSQISCFFNQLFNAQHYNCQYHYYCDAKYWSQHFNKMIKQQKIDKNNNKNNNNNNNKYKNNYIYDYDQEENKENISIEELQFNPASFHLSSTQWNRLTKNEKFQLKYFFVFYHEFSALNYQRIQKKQSSLSTYYIRSRSKNRSYKRNKDNNKDRTKHKKSKAKLSHRSIFENNDDDDQNNNNHKQRENKFVNIKDSNNDIYNSNDLILHYNIRDKSRRHSEDDLSGMESDTSTISSICGDYEVVSEEIIEELNKLELKYENIRLDGYEWNNFFNKWIKYPFIKSLFVNCNIQTLYVGATSFYDESASMMTQLANNAIDLKLENNRKNSRFEYIDHRYNQSKFWQNGGIEWFCDIIKYSYSFTSYLSTIRVLSLRDSNFTDYHLKLFCQAINSRKYESSKSLTINKLVLSKNHLLTDKTMNLLFTTIGNKLQKLEELEINDIGITDKISNVLLDFYTDFHYNYNKVELYSISMLGNLFTMNGFKIMNKLFENDIIDETKFIGGKNKIFHLGVNGRKNYINNNKNNERIEFDMRLHIVIANINGKLSLDND